MSGAFDIAFWHWWVAGLLLLALEAFAPGAVFLWMGVAALVTGGVVALLPGLDWQWAVALCLFQESLLFYQPVFYL